MYSYLFKKTFTELIETELFAIFFKVGYDEVSGMTI